MKSLYVAENLTKCPLTRGVRLWEKFISGGLTVVSFQTAGGGGGLGCMIYSCMAPVLSL